MVAPSPEGLSTKSAPKAGDGAHPARGGRGVQIGQGKCFLPSPRRLAGCVIFLPSQKPLEKLPVRVRGESSSRKQMTLPWRITAKIGGNNGCFPMWWWWKISVFFFPASSTDTSLAQSQTLLSPTF